MKTYYDGEEREVVSISLWTDTGKATYWVVTYMRGDSTGKLIVQAEDELDAMRKFPAELERLSFNPDNEESNKC